MLIRENSIHPKSTSDNLGILAIPRRGEYTPLLFAPSDLLLCGMRDAHSYPQVGKRDSDGVIRASWREPPQDRVDEGANRASEDGHKLRGARFRLR